MYQISVKAFLLVQENKIIFVEQISLKRIKNQLLAYSKHNHQRGNDSLWKKRKLKVSYVLKI